MSTSQFSAGSVFDAPTHPELEGMRVFLSGVDDTTGEALAHSFARQRTRLVLHSRKPASASAALADRLFPAAAAVRLFAGDVATDQAACERLARAGLGAFGGLDLLINVIGANTLSSTVQDSEDFENIIADQLRPALVVSRALADHARNSGQGAAIMHVCLTRSGQGAAMVHYAMLKSALEAMAQDQARRWFSHDICVYGFIPGIAGEPFEDALDGENVVPARSSFEDALCAIVLNAAGGRSRWLNGITIAIPG